MAWITRVDLARLAELVVVDLAHGTSSAAVPHEEDLLGEVELGAGDVALDHLVAEVAAIWITDLRLIPSRIEDVCPGVTSSPSRTTKMFSPEPSQTRPLSSSRIASS